MSRRGFLKVMGASLALAGLAGCTKQPDEPIFPYVKQPEDLILGKPMYFATAHPFPTGAIPVLVKSDAFRPDQGRGQSGASDGEGQVGCVHAGDAAGAVRSGPLASMCCIAARYRAGAEFQQAFATAVQKTAGRAGGLLPERDDHLADAGGAVEAGAAKYPQAKLVQWDPVNQDSSRAASKAAFGDYMDAQYRLEDADVILSLDADFLGGIAHPGFLPLAAAYAERHRYEEGKTMNRLYVVETMPTVTGFKAEHRLALKPSEIGGVCAGAGRPVAALGALSDPERAEVLRARCWRT